MINYAGANGARSGSWTGAVARLVAVPAGAKAAAGEPISDTLAKVSGVPTRTNHFAVRSHVTAVRSAWKALRPFMITSQRAGVMIRRCAWGATSRALDALDVGHTLAQETTVTSEEESLAYAILRSKDACVGLMTAGVRMLAIAGIAYHLVPPSEHKDAHAGMVLLPTERTAGPTQRALHDHQTSIAVLNTVVAMQYAADPHDDQALGGRPASERITPVYDFIAFVYGQFATNAYAAVLAFICRMYGEPLAPRGGAAALTQPAGPRDIATARANDTTAELGACTLPWNFTPVLEHIADRWTWVSGSTHAMIATALVHEMLGLTAWADGLRFAAQKNPFVYSPGWWSRADRVAVSPVTQEWTCTLCDGKAITDPIAIDVACAHSAAWGATRINARVTAYHAVLGCPTLVDVASAIVQRALETTRSVVFCKRTWARVGMRMDSHGMCLSLSQFATPARGTCEFRKF